MMTVSSPAFFAVILLRAVWYDGALDDNDLHWMNKPQITVVTNVEPSLEQCNTDGTNWETQMFTTLEPQEDPLVENGVWQCIVLATGGNQA